MGGVRGWLATTTETYSIKGEIVGWREGGNGKEIDHMCSRVGKSNRNHSGADTAPVIYF